MKRLLLTTLLLWLSGAGAAQLEVREPWVRAMPPVAPMTAGYLVLDNGGTAPAALVGAESPQFREVQLHRSVQVEGMARMERQERIPIPAGGSVELAPGGYHLMLMGAAGPLVPGSTVDLTLRFEDGSSLAVQAPVRQGGEDDEHHHHHHHSE